MEFQYSSFPLFRLRIKSRLLVLTHRSFEQPVWLFSRRLDFWLASAGASAGLLAAILFILWHGDREIDAFDFVLSEFHLGATYEAVIRRRLWRNLPVDILLVPLLILAITYGLSTHGQTMLLTSIAIYAAVWHRGRQSLGVARFYQRSMGGPASPAHNVLFRGAVYLPMLAGLLAYSHLAPLEYEGEPYLAINVGVGITSLAGIAAVGWVIAYFAWTVWRNCAERLSTAPRVSAIPVHPAECWVVLAHAVAFGSGYALGASNASFQLVLAVHHEVQYLYFAYAMSRRSVLFHGANNAEANRVTNGSCSIALFKSEDDFGYGLKHAAFFLVWPVIGFSGAVVGSWLALPWLAPLGVGGLFCHYWLDGCIWTRRSFQN